MVKVLREQNQPAEIIVLDAAHSFNDTRLSGKGPVYVGPPRFQTTYFVQYDARATAEAFRLTLEHFARVLGR